MGYPVYQGPVPLNWGEIIDRVEEDPQAFEKEGGWGFLKWVGKDEAYDYEMSPREESSVASNVSSYDQEDKQSKEQLNKGSALANLLGGNLEDVLLSSYRFLCLGDRMMRYLSPRRMIMVKV